MGLHGTKMATGDIELSAGYHEIKEYYFSYNHGAQNVIYFQGPDSGNRLSGISGNVYHDKSEEDEEEENDLDESKLKLGYLGKHYFFNEATNGNGYNIKGRKPNIVKPINFIAFSFAREYKKRVSQNFPASRFASEYTGYIKIQKGGRYTFKTLS